MADRYKAVIHSDRVRMKIRPEQTLRPDEVPEYTATRQEAIQRLLLACLERKVQAEQALTKVNAEIYHVRRALDVRTEADAKGARQ